MDDDDDFVSYSDLLNSVEAPGVREEVKDKEVGVEPAENAGDLLAQQQKKVELLQLRDELLATRSSVIDQLNRKKRHLHKLKERKEALTADRTLKVLIHQNDSEFAPSVVQKYRTEANLEKDDTENMIQSLDISPSEDWHDRLDIINRFLPNIEIVKASVATEFQRQVHVRIYTFYIISNNVFKVPITITINTADLSILHVEPYIGRKSSSKLRGIGQISPGFNKALTNDFFPNSKIHTIIQGLDSFSQQVYTKTRLFKKILAKFGEYVIPASNLKKALAAKKPDHFLYTYYLKAVDKIEFKGNSDGITFSLRWEITISDYITGECSSIFHVAKQERDVFTDITPTFLKIYEETSVIGALSTMFRILFDITI